MTASYSARSSRGRLRPRPSAGPANVSGFDSTWKGYCPVRGPNTEFGPPREGINMGYGIGGILVLILVILAIIYFAKRV